MLSAITLNPVNPYQRLTRRLSTTAWFRWVLSKILTPLDLRLKGTRFAPSTFGTNAPLCYVTVTGRKTGEARTVPLLFVEHAGGYAVAGTNFGRSHHPGWVYNLEAQPACVLEIEGTAHDARALPLEGDAAVEAWSKFDSIWPGYETYREIAPRDIKVFVLRPV